MESNNEPAFPYQDPGTKKVYPGMTKEEFFTAAMLPGTMFGATVARAMGVELSDEIVEQVIKKVLSVFNKTLKEDENAVQ